jgi:hypothetical protein
MGKKSRRNRQKRGGRSSSSRDDSAEEAAAPPPPPAAATTAAATRDDSDGVDIGNNSSACKHGVPADVCLPDHPFFVAVFETPNCDFSELLRVVLYNDDVPIDENSLRILNNMGTVALLGDEEGLARDIATLVLVIEHSSDGTLIFAHDGLWSETGISFVQRQAALDSRRSLARFFAKRIPCNCLDEIRRETRGERLGKCQACRTSADDAALFDCAACRLVKYCCKECQVRDWPEHRVHCNILRKSVQAAEERRAKFLASPLTDREKDKVVQLCDALLSGKYTSGMTTDEREERIVAISEDLTEAERDKRIVTIARAWGKEPEEILEIYEERLRWRRLEKEVRAAAAVPLPP